MQLPIGEWIDALRVGIGHVPPTILAIVLLGGPTAVWLVYRFLIEPRTSSMRVLERDPFWVCAYCRSVNDHRLTRCYSCDAAPVEDDLELVATHPSEPADLTPVGPGLDLGAPVTTRPGSIPFFVTTSAAFEPLPGYETDEESDDDGDDEKKWEEDEAALPDVATRR